MKSFNIHPSAGCCRERPESVRSRGGLWTTNYQPSTIGYSHNSVSCWESLYPPTAFGRRGDLRHGRQGGGYRRSAFSLLEVVIALGLITVGIVGVLAVFPTALQTAHSAQDETRAAHIAQSVFGSLVAGVTSQFNAVLPFSPLPSPAPTPLSINLTTGSGTTPAVTLYADNDGNLI